MPYISLSCAGKGGVGLQLGGGFVAFQMLLPQPGNFLRIGAQLGVERLHIRGVMQRRQHQHPVALRQVAYVYEPALRTHARFESLRLHIHPVGSHIAHRCQRQHEQQQHRALQEQARADF